MLEKPGERVTAPDFREDSGIQKHPKKSHRCMRGSIKEVHQKNNSGEEAGEAARGTWEFRVFHRGSSATVRPSTMSITPGLSIAPDTEVHTRQWLLHG